jgi:hypothetical protein
MVPSMQQRSGLGSYAHQLCCAMPALPQTLTAATQPAGGGLHRLSGRHLYRALDELGRSKLVVALGRLSRKRLRWVRKDQSMQPVYDTTLGDCCPVSHDVHTTCTLRGANTDLIGVLSDIFTERPSLLHAATLDTSALQSIQQTAQCVFQDATLSEVACRAAPRAGRRPHCGSPFSATPLAG